MNSLCTDIGYVCLNKCGEQLCGDRVEIVEQGDNATVNRWVSWSTAPRERRRSSLRMASAAA